MKKNKFKIDEEVIVLLYNIGAINDSSSGIKAIVCRVPSKYEKTYDVWIGISPLTPKPNKVKLQDVALLKGVVEKNLIKIKWK